jgi:hypothetical protein
MTAPTDTFRELDHRTTDDVDVRLLWNPDTDQVSVEVIDVPSGALLRFRVDGRLALDAFQHPYAYALGDQNVTSVMANR